MANKIHTEKVRGLNKKPRWPYDTTLPSAELYNTVMVRVKSEKEGYVFKGWKHNGTLYTEPFDNETTNPFPTISQNANIFAVWDKIYVYCESNRSVVQASGDTESDLTKITYWAETSNGTIINIGVGFETVPLDDDQELIVYEDRGTNVVNGKNVKTIKISENTDPLNQRFVKFRAYYGNIYSETIMIQQVINGQLILPPFDYMTFTFNWEDSDGVDLDSATMIRDSNLTVESTTLDSHGQPILRNLNDIFVGYGGCKDVTAYIQHGGDNQETGNEGAFINWKRIINEMRNNGLLNNNQQIHLDIYANWYASKRNGYLEHIDFNLYDSPDDDGMSLSNFVFSPIGETELIATKTSQRVYVNARGTMNANGNIDKTKSVYSKIAEITYFVNSRDAKCDFIYQRSGLEYNNVTLKFNGETILFPGGDMTQEVRLYSSNTVKTIEIDKNANSGSFTVSDFTYQVNGVTKTTNVDSFDYVCYKGFTTIPDFTNGVTANINGNTAIINWSCSANTNDYVRTIDTHIRFQSADGMNWGVTVVVKQQANS